MAEGTAGGLADQSTIERTMESLAARNINAVVVESTEEALEKLKELIPQGSEIYYGTSETLTSIGYPQYIHHNPKYKNLHDAYEEEADPDKKRLLHRLSSVSQYYVGSVQAIAETGEILVASASGSQLGAYAYGAERVVLVVGTQKICPSFSDAMDRVRGYTVEMHDQWLAGKGIGPAPIGKMLIWEKENNPERVTVVLIRENLGW